MGDELVPQTAEIDPEVNFRQQLDEFLWVTEITFDRYIGGMTALRVRAIIKPLGVELDDSPIAVRHKILLSYECVLEILDKMGAKHISYPELEIGGDVVEVLGSDEQKLITKADLRLELKVS